MRSQGKGVVLGTRVYANVAQEDLFDLLQLDVYGFLGKWENMGRGLVNMKAYGILGCTSLCSMGISMAVDCLLLLVFTYCRVCLSVLGGT